MDDKIFSISKAAEYLDVFPLTLRNWEKEGKVKAFRTPGGHRRFKKSDLDFIMGISSAKVDKLENTIKNLEAINLNNGRQERLDKIIEELREISTEQLTK